MREYIKKIKKEDAVKLIESMNQDYIYISTIDFDGGDTVSDLKYVKKNTGIDMANKAKTIFYIGEEVSHLDLHSAVQNDIFNIKPKGIINTVYLV